MMNLVQQSVIIASVILSTASGFVEQSADSRSRELTLSYSVCENFAVHAESQITFALTTISGGDVGVSPGTTISGTPITDGEVTTTDASLFAASAKLAWDKAIAFREDAEAIKIPEIGGSIFTNGTWHGGTINIATGLTVTLDGQGDPNSKFLFQADSTMIVGAGCKIVLINEAKAKNVVWALGTQFTSGAGTDFKGAIMAGTSVTVGANNDIEGSILALSAITFGAQDKVNNGCVVALSAITFGTENSVTFVQALDATAIFAALTDNDQFTISCFPHPDAALAAWDNSAIDEAMQDIFNNCTQQGIANAGVRRTRRASGIDIPQFEGDIGIAPTVTLDEDGRRARDFRGVRQNERRVQSLNCDTTDPKPPMVLTIQCCQIEEYKDKFYCGSPGGYRRRELQEEGGGNSTGISVAQMEQYLPSISEECSSQFQALAEDYLDDSNQSATTCFAAVEDVGNLKCTAIMGTEGFATESSISEIAAFGNLTDFPSLAYVNDEFIIACVLLTDTAPTLCKTLSIAEDMQDMLNDCTQQGLINANITRRRASGIDIPQFELGDIVIAPTATLTAGGREARSSTLRGARQKERRLSGMCNTINPNPPLALQLICCYPYNSYPYCGSPMGTRRREWFETTPPISASEVAQYLPSISEECSSQFQALAGVHPTWFEAVEDVGDRKCHALFLTEGESEL
jgi:hypothetical protein